MASKGMKLGMKGIQNPSGELRISSKGARDDIHPFFVFVGRRGGNETPGIVWVSAGVAVLHPRRLSLS